MRRRIKEEEDELSPCATEPVDQEIQRLVLHSFSPFNRQFRRTTH